MALPKLNTPTYELEVPSTDEKISYRPFLVKEEKVLLIALESGKNEEMISAVKNIVSECTFNKLDVESLPMFDIEYIFLNIRAKSVGEVSKLKLLCPDDNETQVPTKINLEDIQVQMTVGHSNEIKITDSVTLHLRDPMFSDASSIGNIESAEGVFKLLNKCIVKIVYGDDEYHRSDISEKDITEFIDQLNSDQFDSIINFFVTAPKLRHVVEVTNPKTKVKGQVLLEGLQSFLE